MARRSPQTQEKRRRERDKQVKLQDKLSRRLERNAQKRDPDAPAPVQEATMTAADFFVDFEEPAPKPAAPKPDAQNPATPGSVLPLPIPKRVISPKPIFPKA